MNNKERFLWLSALILIAFHCLDQSRKIDELETAVSHNTDFEVLNTKHQVFYELLLDSIDMQNESNEQYNELLDLVITNE